MLNSTLDPSGTSRMLTQPDWEQLNAELYLSFFREQPSAELKPDREQLRAELNRTGSSRMLNSNRTGSS